MKTTFVLASVAGLALAISGCAAPAEEETNKAAPAETEAAAETVEAPAENVAFKMDEISCWDLTTTEEDAQAYAATLIFGYAAGAAGNNEQSSEGIEAAIASAVEFCAENPDETALSAFTQGAE